MGVHGLPYGGPRPPLCGSPANRLSCWINSGPPAKADFVAVELVEGHVRLSVDSGHGVVDLFSDVAINDGRWHQLFIEVRLQVPSILNQPST